MPFDNTPPVPRTLPSYTHNNTGPGWMPGPGRRFNAVSATIIDIASFPVIDGMGVTFDTGLVPDEDDFVLVRLQTAAAQNGYYVAYTDAGIRKLKRAGGANNSQQLNGGLTVKIIGSGSLAGKIYALVTPPPITLGGTALVFAEMDMGVPRAL